MDDFTDDDIFADLDLVGVKQSRALQAFDKLPEELAVRFEHGLYGITWRLAIPRSEFEALNALARDALPAVSVFTAGDMTAPWNRYGDSEQLWQRLYTAPSFEFGYHSYEGALAAIKQSRFFRVKPMSLDEYTRNVLENCKHNLQYNRPRVGLAGGLFDQLLMRMRQCVIVLSGDPKLADVSQYGKRKVDAFNGTHNKLRELLGKNPLNVSVIEDVLAIARIVSNILNPNTKEARAIDQLKKLGALRKEFVETGSVRSVSL